MLSLSTVMFPPNSLPLLFDFNYFTIGHYAEEDHYSWDLFKEGMFCMPNFCVPTHQEQYIHLNGWWFSESQEIDWDVLQEVGVPREVQHLLNVRTWRQLFTIINTMYTRSDIGGLGHVGTYIWHREFRPSRLNIVPAVLHTSVDELHRVHCFPTLYDVEFTQSLTYYTLLIANHLEIPMRSVGASLEKIGVMIRAGPRTPPYDLLPLGIYTLSWVIHRQGEETAPKLSTYMTSTSCWAWSMGFIYI